MIESEWNLLGQVDELDPIFQEEIDLLPENLIDISVIPVGRIEKRFMNGREVYNRNSSFSKIRFLLGGYKCEINPEHITFISERTKMPFIASHHLIPMNFQ
ncbi:MAG: hypothetical protein ABIX01_21265 [Chitinophagaceae bacterium]